MTNQSPESPSWLRIEVAPLGHHGLAYAIPRHREILVGPEHTFADLSAAIETAFDRSDGDPGYASRSEAALPTPANDIADPSRTRALKPDPGFALRQSRGRNRVKTKP